MQGEANPLDPEWKEYFEKRKTYKMLQSLNGRKSLLYMWEKQNHVCLICGEPINKEHSWGINERIVNGKKVNFLVYDSCRRKVIQLKNVTMSWFLINRNLTPLKPYDWKPSSAVLRGQEQ